MKLITNVLTMRIAIENLLGAVEKKNRLEILQNILIEQASGESRAKLSASNLEIGKETYIESKNVGGDPFAVTIPAQTCFLILKELNPDDPITLTVDDAFWVNLDSGKSHFRVAGLPAKDFPALPLPNTSGDMISAENLETMIGKVAFAVSHDESRYTLTGILWEQNNFGFRLTATDGHRLASAHGGNDHVQDFAFILPLRAALELKKLCSQGDTVHYGLEDTQVWFRCGDTMLFSRTIDGNFPKYQDVIPKENEFAVTLDKTTFQQLIGRVQLLSGDSRLVKCEFSPDTLTGSCNDPNAGEATETMPVTSCGAKVMQYLAIGFNARYLQDALNVLDEDAITLQLQTELHPARIDEDGLTLVLMPMRV